MNNFVIVKTRYGAVYCGFLEDRGPSYARLSQARNIWEWAGANTLNELANGGASTTKSTKISDPAKAHVEIVEAEVILECTEAAAENLQQSRWLT